MKNTGTLYRSTEKTPTVFPEFRDLLPPLSQEQQKALERDILQNGCYAPLIVDQELRVVDGQANDLLFRAPADFGAKLRRHGAVVRGCGNYPGLDETWYRTAVRTQKENEQLLKIMREVLA